MKDRARAVGVRAGILVTQAGRTSQAVSQALNGSGDHDAASDEFRTYIMMLLAARCGYTSGHTRRKSSAWEHAAG